MPSEDVRRIRVALNYARFHGGSWNVLDEEITRLEARIAELEGALDERCVLPYGHLGIHRYETPSLTQGGRVE